MIINHCTCGACYSCKADYSTSSDWDIGVPDREHSLDCKCGCNDKDPILERLDRIIALLEGMDCECDNDEDEDSVMHDLRGECSDCVPPVYTCNACRDAKEHQDERTCLDSDGGICYECCEKMAEGIRG